MGRKLTIVLVLVVLALAAGIVYYFINDQGLVGSENNNGNPEEQQGTTFINSGILMRNNAGLKPDTWFLSYETPGTPGRFAELVIDENSICEYSAGDGGTSTANCGGNLSYSQGTRIEVEGLETQSGVVKVSRIRQVNPASPNQPSGLNPFTKSDVYGYYGTVTLNGYLQAQRRVCNPGDMCGETVDYAFFVFENSDNAAIKEFAGPGDYTGNSFVGQHAIGIGCQQKDQSRILYQNDADIGFKEGEIKDADYTKLVASTKENSVQLKMMREVYTSGRGAPDCYSHFRNFDVL